MLTRAVLGSGHEIASGAAVVIDVFRAFSTAALAMTWGANRVILVDSVASAQRLQRSIPGSLTLTDGPRRDDVDLTNSPAMLADVDLAARTLICKTNNGTTAALAARRAEPLLCASFVNARATADYLRGLGVEEITFVASGRGDAEEDVACADYMRALLAEPDTDPASYLERTEHSASRGRLRAAVAAGHTGIHARDVEFCRRVDTAPFALLGRCSGDAVVLETARKSNRSVGEYRLRGLPSARMNHLTGHGKAMDDRHTDSPR